MMDPKVCPIFIMYSMALPKYSLQWECPICVMGSGMCVALTMFSMLWACLKNWFRRVGKSAMVWPSLLLLVVGVEGVTLFRGNAPNLRLTLDLSFLVSSWSSLRS